MVQEEYMTTSVWNIGFQPNLLADLFRYAVADGSSRIFGSENDTPP